MKSPRLIISLGIIALAGLMLYDSPPAESEAGIFRNRYGEPRQPLRRIAQAVRQVAANRLGAGCSGFNSAGCGGVAAAPMMVCDANGCSIAAYVAPDAVDQAAAKAFTDALLVDDLAAVVPEEPQSRSSDSVQSSAAAARVIPLPNVRLAEREKRLGPIERIVWNRVKARPDLRKAIAEYGKARGMGAIDPNNLSQLLDVLLAFFEKLLPLILQLLSASPPATAPPLVLLC